MMIGYPGLPKRSVTGSDSDLGLRNGFEPPGLERPGRLPHQQGLCEVRLGCRGQDESPSWGPGTLGLRSLSGFDPPDLDRPGRRCRINRD